MAGDTLQPPSLRRTDESVTSPVSARRAAGLPDGDRYV